MKSSDENQLLSSKVRDYESTAATLTQTLAVEKESRQQSANEMGQQLDQVQGQLSEMEGRAKSMEQKNEVSLKKETRFIVSTSGSLRCA